MTNNVSIHLREELPLDIVKGANLEKTMNDLFKNFETGEQRNADLVNRFFNQSYFRGEESLINKLTEIKPDIKFEDIKDEGINLATLLYDNWIWDFYECMNKIGSIDIKRAFLNEIYNKVRAKIGAPTAPYNDFDTKCAIPLNANVVEYFQKIVSYLESKEGAGGSAKKAIEILKEINIKNENLNNGLPAGTEISTGVNLTDPSIPASSKQDFDTLLSFEIGKEADRTIQIADDFSKTLQGLFTNSIPAINTVVGESEEYRYNEEMILKRYPEYQGRLDTINNDANLNENEKKKQTEDLKREFYLKYLKTKNLKIGNALEQLYNNDFDYSKVASDNPTILKDYFDAVANIRLKKLFDHGMNEFIKLNFGNVDEFKSFYKNLTDPSKKNIVLNDVNIVVPGGTTGGGILIPIQKKITEGKNERLKDDIEQFGKNADKSFDAFPMEYTINKADIDALDITIEDKTKLLKLLSKFDQGDKYEIKGESIGVLIYLFFIINSKIPLATMNPEKQKEVEGLFGQAKNSEHKEGEDEENKEESEPAKEEYTSQNFKEDIEKLGQGKLENGSEIWLPMGDSELPGGGYQWMKVKISNIDMTKGTFKGTVYGGELKFNSKLEGKTREFKMNKEFFDKLNEIIEKAGASKEKIWLLPNPNSSDFNSFRDKLGGKLGTGELAFPPSGVTWTGDKFTQKIIDEDGKEKEVEVKYFGASADDKSTYKVEYNPIRKSFTVSSSFNGDEKGKDGKSEKKRFSYKRDMDWNNFLIFFTQKGLVPQTEAEASSALARQDNEFKVINSGHRKLNWFSINNIKNVFKTIKGNIKKKIDDYNKAQDQKLEDILVGDRGIYGGLANILGFIPSIKGGLGELQQEYYNERDNRTWKKIEYYLKIFQSDPDFGTTFDQVPPFAKILGGKSYKNFIEDLAKPNASRSANDIHKAAALLLANIEKGGSPYRGLSEDENSGLWVKILLGEAHYEQFMRDKAKLIRARNAAENGGEGDKKGLNETLDVCEWKYIINNIRGSYGGLIVGSHESRGIPKEDGTNYIDNPAKRLLSDQFATKLESAYQGRFNKDSVNDKYNKFKKNNSFDEIENEFGKASSTRYQTGQAALRRMIDLATNDDLIKRMKKCFLTYLLSGALDIHCDPKLKKQVYEWAKPMMFVPGLLVKEAGVAENIAILLDEATGDFSSNITKYFHRNKELNGSTEFKGLQKEINNWLTDERMNKLDKFFSELPTQNFENYAEPKRSILKKYQKAMSGNNREEQDRGVLENPKVASNGLLSSVEVVQKRMNIKNGEFNGKDIDDNNNMKDFWDKVTKDINSRTTEPRQVAFVLEKFINRFGIDNQQLYEWIVTANFYNEHRGQFSLPYKNIELNMGNIEDKEIESILWYAFQGNAWKSRGLGCDRIPDEIFKTLEAFRKYFSKAFHDKTLLDGYVIKKAFNPKFENIKPLLMGSWNVYDQVFAGDGELPWMDSSASDDDLFSGDDSKKRKAKKNKIKELLRSSDFINSDIVNIEKQLKRNLGGTSGLFPTVTSSTSKSLRDEYLKGLLAA